MQLERPELNCKIFFANETYQSAIEIEVIKIVKSLLMIFIVNAKHALEFGLAITVAAEPSKTLHSTVLSTLYLIFQNIV